MDATQYYITTLSNAFKNLAPIAIFLVGGYFIFIKLPFLFLKKSMDSQKKKLDEESRKPALEEKYTVEDYQAFQRRLKMMNGEEKKQSKAPPHEETKKKTQAPPKRPVPSSGQSPEEILGFKVDETVTKLELKKRYFELLKQNHPDRVASMGEDFKKLAEKNTKEINQAYEKLKKKAA
jgi:hypothetical protein